MVVVLPANVTFPDTSSTPMDALNMVSVPTVAFAMLAVVMVAVWMTLATGITVVPVKVALSLGALSKCRESYAFFRSVISWPRTAVKSAKWEMTSEFTRLPMLMLVINVQL